MAEAFEGLKGFRRVGDDDPSLPLTFVASIPT